MTTINTSTANASTASANTSATNAPAPNEMPSFEGFRSFELKIKVMSLGAEIRMIHDNEIKLKKLARKSANYPESQKQFYSDFWSLRKHREELSPMERDAHLAYGFLRGRSYLRMEPKRYSDPNWGAIERMILKHGSRIGQQKLKQSFEQWKQEAGKALPESERQERKRLAAEARKALKAAA